MDNAKAETFRIFLLSRLVIEKCEGSSLNNKAANTFIESAGYYKIKGKNWDDASFLANSWFNYFDYAALAHLCAGSDYLFGSKGKLVKNLVKSGKGEPKLSIDEDRGYIRLRPLPKSE